MGIIIAFSDLILVNKGIIVREVESVHFYYGCWSWEGKWSNYQFQIIRVEQSGIPFSPTVIF